MNVIRVKLDERDSKRLEMLEEKITKVESLLKSASNDDERFLDKHQVQKMVKFSETTLKEKIKEGLFPSPIEIFSRNRWKYSDIKKWMEEASKTM